jgi:hypothetical protein
MKQLLEVGDLVKDKLNKGDQSYGLGVVVGIETRKQHICRLKKTAEGMGMRMHGNHDTIPSGKKYQVYFTKFEKTITFHGDYLEKV